MVVLTLPHRQESSPWSPDRLQQLRSGRTPREKINQNRVRARIITEAPRTTSDSFLCGLVLFDGGVVTVVVSVVGCSVVAVGVVVGCATAVFVAVRVIADVDRVVTSPPASLALICPAGYRSTLLL